MKNYITVIGLEVHAELKTKTKAFCSCSTEFGSTPNTHVCPVCLGMPGALPVLNKQVVEFAIVRALHWAAKFRNSINLTVKTTFTPTLPKTTRFLSLTSRFASAAILTLKLTACPNALALPAFTWKKTQAS